jgi:hypothetical protein
MKFEYRDTATSDLPEIQRWISADSCPKHNGVDPAFWMPETNERTVRSKCLAVMNDEGKVIFYLKLENVMRCLIQFPPDAESDPITTRLALKSAFLDISGGAKHIGYNEIIFESESKGLINLFGKFGFEEATNNFLVRL